MKTFIKIIIVLVVLGLLAFLAWKIFKIYDQPKTGKSSAQYTMQATDLIKELNINYDSIKNKYQTPTHGYR